MMRMLDKIYLAIATALEVLLAYDIVVTVVNKEVSVTSFVCVALIAMSQIGVNLLDSFFSRKSRAER